MPASAELCRMPSPRPQSPPRHVAGCLGIRDQSLPRHTVREFPPVHPAQPSGHLRENRALLPESSSSGPWLLTYLRSRVKEDYRRCDQGVLHPSGESCPRREQSQTIARSVSRPQGNCSRTEGLPPKAAPYSKSLPRVTGITLC